MLCVMIWYPSIIHHLLYIIYTFSLLLYIMYRIIHLLYIIYTHGNYKAKHWIYIPECIIFITNSKFFIHIHTYIYISFQFQQQHTLQIKIICLKSYSKKVYTWNKEKLNWWIELTEIGVLIYSRLRLRSRWTSPVIRFEFSYSEDHFRMKLGHLFPEFCKLFIL